MKRFIRIILPVLLCTLLALTLWACDAAMGKLGNPDVTTVRYADGFITWGAVEGAVKYRIRINEGSELTVASPQYPYADSANSFTIQITAIDGNEKASETVVKTFMPLATIKTITVGNDGSLSWESIPGATSYEVQIDGGNVQMVTATEYKGLTAGAHAVKVRPIVAGDSTYFSSWSAQLNVTVLETVNIADIKYSDGTITWKYVSGAAAYEVAVNGRVQIGRAHV